MKQTQRQKGFILLLVIAMIPLLGMASVVLTSNSRQILTNTRRAALKTQARFACESGIAWIKTNTPETHAKEQPIVLEISPQDKNITCIIELVSRTDKQSVFKITGHAEDKRFSNDYSEQYLFKH
jgi:type II secretory pathway pseudopilin PulG